MNSLSEWGGRTQENNQANYALVTADAKTLAVRAKRGVALTDDEWDVVEGAGLGEGFDTVYPLKSYVGTSRLATKTAERQESARWEATQKADTAARLAKEQQEKQAKEQQRRSRALAMLKHIPQPDTKEAWASIGYALRQIKFAPTTSADLFDWCATYSLEECGALWESPIPSDTGTIFNLARQHGWADTGRAALIWNQCRVVNPTSVGYEGAYLNAHHGTSDGLRWYASGATTSLDPLGFDINNRWLVIPCWEGDELQTLQFISPEGVKHTLPDADYGDGFFTVGEISENETVYVCPEIEQAWALHHVTRCAAVVCFDADRMQAVAKILRTKLSTLPLVFVAARGDEDKAADAATTFNGQSIALYSDDIDFDSAEAYAEEHGTDTLTALLGHTKPPPLRFKPLDTVALCDAPPVSWRVRGVLPATGLATIYGAISSGKSFLAIDLACAIAGGEDWFGLRVKQAPVFYVYLEAKEGLGKRLKAWSLQNNKPVPNEFHPLTAPFNLLAPTDVLDLSVSVNVHDAKVIIIDTLNRAAPGADENSSTGMGAIIKASERLQDLTGALVLLIHHTGKDASKGLRGHSSLGGALDTAIEVFKSEKGRSWGVVKTKDDSPIADKPFRLEIIRTGQDEDGEEVTSCAVISGVEGSPKPTGPALRANQAIALDVLTDALSKSPHIEKGGAPAGKPCVDYTEALELVAAELQCEVKNQKPRARIAVESLIGMGTLHVADGWLWAD